jgi:hypothetical protein
MVSRRAGLDWAQVDAAMRLRGIPRRDRAAMMDGLRAMEAETLDIIAEQAAREARQARR